MRLHPSLLTAVVDTVYTIFNENKKADKAIQATLKSNRKWGSRDRAFIAQYSYEMVRWWRLLHFINETNIDNRRSSVIWRLLGILLRLQEIDLPEIKEFQGVSRNKVKARFQEGQNIRKVRESLPDWLDNLCYEELGEDWSELARHLNKQAPLCIRVNTLKTSLDELKQMLSKQVISLLPLPDLPNAAYFRERINVHALEEFKNGFFEIQDAGSQLIGSFLDVQPGMRVIDACAGAGGKSLQMACAMQNKGTIIAMDTEEWKLEELKKRAKRNGIHNIDTRVISGKVIKRLRESADAVLLDVPCSGLGVLRRNPDAKWKLQPEFIEEIKKTQAEILQNYSTMLKPGGNLVYATCSILPSENQDQVRGFLEKNQNFSMIKWCSTSPNKEGYDGFYMALLKKEE